MKRVLLALLLLIASTNVHAAITFPWTNTFDGSEWTDGVCDAGFDVPDWSCGGVNNLINGEYGSVISTANYSSGEGGRGYKAWYSSTTTGSNQISVSWSSVSEVWVRFYMNMDGITTLDEPKTLYFGGGGATSNWFAVKVKKSGAIYINENSTGCDGGVPGDCLSTSTPTANPTGWHYYEFHITTGASADIEAWQDGVAYEFANLPTGYALEYVSGGMTGFTLNVNASGVSTGYVYYDDFAMSTTGYIGPVGGGGGEESGAKATVLQQPGGMTSQQISGGMTVN